MVWFKIAWRNLWRNRRRTLIQLAVISGSMFLAIFYNNFSAGALASMVRSGVRSGSGDIGIYQRDYLADRRPSDTFLAGPILSELATDPDVVTALPRVHLPGLLQSAYGSRPAEATGLDFAREAELNPFLASKYFLSGGLPSDSRGLVIGEILARKLKVTLGDKVVWMAQDVHGQIASGLFRVAGIIRTNVSSVDAGLVVGSRTALASLIGRPGAVHEIAVQLQDPSSLRGALPRIERIAASVPGARAYPWQQAMPDLASLIEVSAAKQKATDFILFVIVAIGTLNTMLMSVMERTREFGMMRALGIGKRAIR
ncbi:MAG: ABC transporter permease, partial [Cyanobacteria bacterium REEB65]|nr:ABC transporter permease [Cyanobacteria bacterium REEB65]